jgi:hypothetical protein
MTNFQINTIEKQIKDNQLEMLRIHENTLWWNISEKKANILGDRIEFLDKQIEKLRESIN